MLNIDITTKNTILLYSQISEMYYKGQHNEFKNVKSSNCWFDFIC